MTPFSSLVWNFAYCYFWLLFGFLSQWVLHVLVHVEAGVVFMWWNRLVWHVLHGITLSLHQPQMLYIQNHSNITVKFFVMHHCPMHEHL